MPIQLSALPLEGFAMNGCCTRTPNNQEGKWLLRITLKLEVKHQQVGRESDPCVRLPARIATNHMDSQDQSGLKTNLLDVPRLSLDLGRIIYISCDGNGIRFERTMSRKPLRRLQRYDRARKYSGKKTGAAKHPTCAYTSTPAQGELACKCLPVTTKRAFVLVGKT